MKVVAMAGGTGSSKLLRGLAGVVRELTVIANVGDNFWFHGLYVCPDVDVAMYAMAGISDGKRGWGIRGDTFNAIGQIGKLGAESWFKLGDMDMAASLLRTRLLSQGMSLTKVTLKMCRALGLHSAILPATNSQVETRMITESGSMHLQEYWVRDRGRHRVAKVKYVGARSASPTEEVRRAIASADRVIFCPANPVTSICPILAISEMRSMLSRRRAKVVALSPMVGAGPYSGPAGSLMKQLGIKPNSFGVASLYADFVRLIVIDGRDASLKPRIEQLGVECKVTNTMMRSRSGERKIALALLEA